MSVQVDAGSALARVLFVGAGGLSCPVARVLAQSGATAFTFVDDDRVDLSNLHRQTLFDERDVGRLKAEVASENVARFGPVTSRAVIDRFTPDNAPALLAGHTLVIDGADNFASKFLIADAARLAGVPVVHAGVVRMAGWALSTPHDGACLRCVFEDMPSAAADSCAVAGVLGPVVGVVGALEALLAVDLARGLRAGRAHATLCSFDARRGTLRRRAVSRRMDCPLCTGQIRDLSIDRYVAQCAA